MGAPKCGTSSLCEWLRTHPKVFIPVKEPDQFSPDVVPPGYGSIGSYKKLYADAGCRVAGDASTTYLRSSLAIKSIIRANPDAKVIVAVRNPVDLAVSFHGQMLREGIESEPDFERAWRLQDMRRAGRSIPKTCPFPRSLDYLWVASIGTQLQRVYEDVPPSRVHTIVLDDLAADPGTVYRRLLAFLELPDDGRLSFPVKNPRVGLRSHALNRHLLAARRAAEPALRTLCRMTGRQGTGLVRLVNRVNLIGGVSAPALDAGFRRSLVAAFADQVRLLEEILERDFDLWRVADAEGAHAAC